MEYWTVSHAVANRTYTCRECKRTINKTEKITSRDGRKIRLIYHASCFSGDADPRSQAGSSFNAGRLPTRAFQEQAPRSKGQGKWSVGTYGLVEGRLLPSELKQATSAGTGDGHEPPPKG